MAGVLVKAKMRIRARTAVEWRNRYSNTPVWQTTRPSPNLVLIPTFHISRLVRFPHRRRCLHLLIHRVAEAARGESRWPVIALDRALACERDAVAAVARAWGRDDALNVLRRQDGRAGAATRHVHELCGGRCAGLACAPAVEEEREDGEGDEDDASDDSADDCSGVAGGGGGGG